MYTKSIQYVWIVQFANASLSLLWYIFSLSHPAVHPVLITEVYSHSG